MSEAGPDSHGAGRDRPVDNGARIRYCGASGVHRPHEWIDGVVRVDCPGEPDPATSGAPLRYDREVLTTVLIYHARTDTSGCHCGWADLGASYADHVADVYEQSIAREDVGRTASRWAHKIRLDEREAVIGVFRLVMSGKEFEHRHVDDAVGEIVEAVEDWYVRVQ